MITVQATVDADTQMRIIRFFGGRVHKKSASVVIAGVEKLDAVEGKDYDGDVLLSFVVRVQILTSAEIEAKKVTGFDPEAAEAEVKALIRMLGLR